MLTDADGAPLEAMWTDTLLKVGFNSFALENPSMRIIGAHNFLVFQKIIFSDGSEHELQPYKFDLEISYYSGEHVCQMSQDIDTRQITESIEVNPSDYESVNSKVGSVVLPIRVLPYN